MRNGFDPVLGSIPCWVRFHAYPFGQPKHRSNTYTSDLLSLNPRMMLPLLQIIMKLKIGLLCTGSYN